MAYKISTFSELCVLYERTTREVIKEGSLFYCQAIRDSIPNGKAKTNIVTSKFFKEMLAPC